MFILDDILFAPVKGFATVCQKVQEAARQELDANEQAIMARLAELHRLLESARIDEEEFDLQENALLEQLEKARQR